MTGNRNSSISEGGGGGGGIGTSSGWVESNFISQAFFNQLFEVRGTKTTTVGSADPTVEDYVFAANEMPQTVSTTDEGVTTTIVTAITDIKVKAGIWTNSYISALGQNDSGGGGGGGSSTLAGLLDVQLSSPQPGQILKYGNDAKWHNANEQTSGGTVTNVATGTGLTGGPITSSGTIAIDSTCLTYISHGESAYQWMQSNPLAGYATTSQLSNYLPLSGGTLTGGLNLRPTSGNEGGELHLNASATEASQAGIVLDQYNSTFRIFGIESADGTTKVGTGTALVIDPYAKTITGGYSFDGSAASAGRLSGMGTYTAWGRQYWANGVPNSISGDMTDVGKIEMTGGLYLHNGNTGLYINSDGTGIDWHNSSNSYISSLIGFTSSLVTMYQQLYIPADKSLRIGDALLMWDSNNNALKITKKVNGSDVACNLFATGGVSALGLSAGGSIDTLTVNTQLTMGGNILFNAGGKRINPPSNTNLFIGNQSDTDTGYICMANMCSQYNDASKGDIYWYIMQNGEARFSQLYLSNSCYMYVSDTHLYFFNGTTTYTVI